MKRTILGLFLVAGFAAPALGKPPAPPAPPRVLPVPPVPPLPPLPPEADELDDDHEGPVSTETAVKAAVALRLETLSGDVRAVAGAAGRVRVRIDDSRVRDVRIVALSDNRYELAFDGRPRLLDGNVTIELPGGSSLDANTMSGDIRVEGLGGDVRVKSASGDIRVDKAATLDARSISGGVLAHAVGGAARVKTVSGDIDVQAVAPAQIVELASTSGQVRWRGRCAAECRMTAHAMSGDIELDLDAASSFELRYITHTGDFTSSLPVTVTTAGEAPHEHELRGRVAKADGSIEVQSFSGDLALKPR